MSKIGQEAIQFDSSKITVKIEDGGLYRYLHITVDGPKGSLEASIRKGVGVEVIEW